MKDITTSTSLNFTINGMKFYNTSSISSSMMLINFIRKETNLFGMKVLCREAGCGGNVSRSRNWKPNGILCSDSK